MGRIIFGNNDSQIVQEEIKIANKAMSSTINENIVEVIKEIKVEVPVEVIKEVEKIVEVEKQVEVVKEIIVEVPVEVIKEVIIEKIKAVEVKVVDQELSDSLSKAIKLNQELLERNDKLHKDIEELKISNLVVNDKVNQQKKVFYLASIIIAGLIMFLAGVK